MGVGDILIDTVEELWDFFLYNVIPGTIFGLVTIGVGYAFSLILSELLRIFHVPSRIRVFLRLLTQVITGIVAIILFFKLLALNWPLLVGFGVLGFVLPICVSRQAANIFEGLVLQLTDVILEGDTIEVNGIEGQVLEFHLYSMFMFCPKYNAVAHVHYEALANTIILRQKGTRRVVVTPSPGTAVAPATGGGQVPAPASMLSTLVPVAPPQQQLPAASRLLYPPYPQ